VRLENFDFPLPDDRIAMRPVRPRSTSRMLVWQQGTLADRTVQDLPTLLAPGDRLVINTTKVIPARLQGTRIRPGANTAGTMVTANLDRRLTEDTWIALAKPLKRLRPGDRIRFEAPLAADVVAIECGVCRLQFSLAGDALDAVLAKIGALPLPPYISRHRSADEADEADYQSIFARHPGAVAAPTASLHFDDALLDALKQHSVAISMITLHIASGTFKPVTEHDIEDHTIHHEHCIVEPAAATAINATRAAGGRVIPVGTAALRAVECAAVDGEVRPWRGTTNLYIRPGYRFRIADGLLTNFHMPQTSLVILVAAMVGLKPFRSMYRHAIEKGYRFLSYGDCNLLLP